jgi:MacB-like protein
MEIRALLSALWRSRTGPFLVAAQVAITLAVIVNVTYIVQQRLKDASKPTGIDLDNMFWVGLETLDTNYNQAAAVPVDLTYLNSLPGVVSATSSQMLPQSWGRMGLPFAADPKQLDQPNGGVGGAIYFGTDTFIETLGLKLVAGRTFDRNAIMPPSSDMAAAIANWAPEMIVTQAMAKKLFPKGDALGKTVYAGLTNKSSTIVGIVDYMQAQPGPERWQEFALQIVIVPIIAPGPGGNFIVRTRPGERDRVMAKVEKEFADLQPGRYVRRIDAYDHSRERRVLRSCGHGRRHRRAGRFQRHDAHEAAWNAARDRSAQVPHPSLLPRRELAHYLGRRAARVRAGAGGGHQAEHDVSDAAPAALLPRVGSGSGVGRWGAGRGGACAARCGHFAGHRDSQCLKGRSTACRPGHFSTRGR